MAQADDAVLAIAGDHDNRQVRGTRTPQQVQLGERFRGQAPGDEPGLRVIADGRAEPHPRTGPGRDDGLVEPFAAGGADPVRGDRGLSRADQMRQRQCEVDTRIAQH